MDGVFLILIIQADTFLDFLKVHRWREPCPYQFALIVFAYELEKFEAEYGAQVKVAKINVDEEPELAAKFGVASIPTLVKFDGGAEASRVVGFNDKAGLAKNCKDTCEYH